MVEWTIHEKLSLLACVLTIIGSLLPWWSFTEKDLGMIVSFININPIIDSTSQLIYFSLSDYLYLTTGMIALNGAVLLFVAIKKPLLGVLGGVLVLFGPILFMIFIQIEVPNIADYFDSIQTNAFVFLSFIDNYGIPGYGLTLDMFVSYGSIFLFVGGIIGILGYTKREVRLLA